MNHFCPALLNLSANYREKDPKKRMRAVTAAVDGFEYTLQRARPECPLIEFMKAKELEARVQMNAAKGAGKR
jgi:hypothetical protein